MGKKVNGSAKGFNGARIAVLRYECCPIKRMHKYVSRWAVEQL
jgi:hypothetical protein